MNLDLFARTPPRPRPRPIGCRVAWFTFILITTAVSSAALNWTLPRPHPPYPQSAVVPPPTHIEWDEHEAGGYLLTRPAGADSLGSRTLQLPEGTLILIPRLVVGDPDAS